MIKHPEINICCATCEWSSPVEGKDDFVFCHKKKKELDPLRSCRKYAFDLLKYAPAKPKQVITLDPTILEL